MVADIHALAVMRRAKCQERDDARIEADKVCSEWAIARAKLQNYVDACAGMKLT